MLELAICPDCNGRPAQTNTTISCSWCGDCGATLIDARKDPIFTFPEALDDVTCPACIARSSALADHAETFVVEIYDMVRSYALTIADLETRLEELREKLEGAQSREVAAGQLKQAGFPRSAEEVAAATPTRALEIVAAWAQILGTILAFAQVWDGLNHSPSMQLVQQLLGTTIAAVGTQMRQSGPSLG